jgi:uncharacterized protein YdeI (YjbR/CyaY-like superfamily)
MRLNDGMVKLPQRRAAKDLPTVDFATPAAWNAWLEKHHARARGIWLKFAKKHSGVASVRYPEALEIALCYGWIDGLVRRLDDQYYVQRFTPRTARSKWSKINCGKADALIAAGKMKPAGLRQVESAKADGRWGAAYDSPRTATMPPDFRKALSAKPAARKFFTTLSARNRYAILFRIHDAKRPETRVRRIEQFVEMLSNQSKPYP